MTKLQKTVTAALCLALCVVLPLAFHMIPDAGSVFCPIHIPVLICGLVCGPTLGMVCGLFGPLLSNLFTGMPYAAYLAPMMLELAVYGLVAGALFLVIKTKRYAINLYLSLVFAMLLGRVAAGVAKAFIFMPGEFSAVMWATSYFVTAWPGIVIQLVFIPAIVFALKKAKLI